MIITPPRRMECWLEPHEIEIAENCIVLLKDIRDKMNEYDYSFLHVSDDSTITNGELTELVMKLIDLTHIDEMH